MLGRRTRHKLEEARFFLRKLRESNFRVAEHLADDSPPVPEFLYFLSAFISSARSVAWVMRSEYSDVEGWDGWYKGEEQLQEEEELLAAFANLRNVNEKQGDLIATWSPSFAEIPAEGVASLPPEHRDKPRYRISFVEVEKEHQPDTKIEMLSYVEKVVWRTPNLCDRDLLVACDRYFRMLDLLVRKCERQFAVHVNEPIGM